uniref:LisH domain-containing protein n=1 Tax=Physcomitrium patens TaxID=3218 RepID=A0A7I4DAC1_PHYPA
MAQSNWEADKMLDVYIYDYLIKRNLQASAKAFLNEGKVSSDPVAIDAPGGFLFEWWSVFWDIFIARTNEKHSEVAASYIETQQLKAREQQQQQQQQAQAQQQQAQQQVQQQQAQQQQAQQAQQAQVQQQQVQQQQAQQQHQQQQAQAQQQQQLQQMQLQILQQRHAQQRREASSHLLNGSGNGPGSEAMLRQPTANAMATKIYEERLKHPHQRDALDETAMKVVVMGVGCACCLREERCEWMWLGGCSGDDGCGRSGVWQRVLKREECGGEHWKREEMMGVDGELVVDVVGAEVLVLGARRVLAVLSGAHCIGCSGRRGNVEVVEMGWCGVVWCDVVGWGGRSGGWMVDWEVEDGWKWEWRPLLAGNATTALQQVQVRSQMSGSSQDNKHDALNQRSPAPESGMFGVPGVGHSKPALLSPGSAGVNQGVNQGSLKGWPPSGMDQLRPGLVGQGQKPFIQGPNQYQQFQMLTSQQQQQLLLQAQVQGNMSSSGSPLLNEMDPRRFRVLLGGRSGLTKDGQSNASSDISGGGVGSPMQVASSLPRGGPQDQTQAELMMKGGEEKRRKGAKDRSGQANADASNSFRQSEPVYGGLEPSPSTNSTGTGKQAAVRVAPSARKRKQPASFSGPANSTGTANTEGPNSAPSTPSTHTPGDVMSMAGALQHSGSTSKPLLMYGADGTGPLASPSNQLADMDRFGEDGSLDDNVESFLSHEEADPRESLFGSSKWSPAGHSMDVSKG